MDSCENGSESFGAMELGSVSLSDDLVMTEMSD
jgi:hypothetical protein